MRDLVRVLVHLLHNTPCIASRKDVWQRVEAKLRLEHQHVYCRVSKFLHVLLESGLSLRRSQGYPTLLNPGDLADTLHIVLQTHPAQLQVSPVKALYLEGLAPQPHHSRNSKVDCLAARRPSQVKAEDCLELLLPSLHRAGVYSGLQHRNQLAEVFWARQRLKRPAAGYLEQQHHNQPVEDFLEPRHHNPRKAVGFLELRHHNRPQAVASLGLRHFRLLQAVDYLDQLHNQHKGEDSLVLLHHSLRQVVAYSEHLLRNHHREVVFLAP